MRLLDKAVIEAIELGAETSVGKAAIAASTRFAEELTEHFRPRAFRSTEDLLKASTHEYPWEAPLFAFDLSKGTMTFPPINGQ